MLKIINSNPINRNNKIKYLIIYSIIMKFRHNGRKNQIMKTKIYLKIIELP